MGADLPPARYTAAALLIGDCGRFLFQLRDDIPNILFPGMLGLFGGHIEDGESPLETVAREIHEETGYLAPSSAFQPLLTCSVPISGGGTLHETFFLLENVPTDTLVISEGKIFPVAREDVPHQLHRMTPGTCCAVQTIFTCDRFA